MERSLVLQPMKSARLLEPGMPAGELIEPMYCRANLSHEHICMQCTQCSGAANLRVRLVVNGNTGVHMMLEKKYLGA